MTLLRRLPAMALAISFLVAGPLQVHAQEGYTFKPVLTQKNAAKDADGIWAESDLTASGDPASLPNIYTAKITTPAGEWTLSQLDTFCSMQSNCQFRLVLKKKDGSIHDTVLGGTLLLGGTAVLSQNYKKITTEEVDDEAKPFTGSYDVDAR